MAQTTGGPGVPKASGTNCGGVPGGTSTTGCGGVPSVGAVPTAIHFWPMNEGTGTTLHDNIGTTNLATSNVTWAVSTGLGASSVAQFNGTSSAAAASGVDSTLNFNGTQPMTIAFWIRPTSISAGIFAGNLQTASNYQGWEASMIGAGNNGMLIVGTVTTNQMSAGSTLADLAASTSYLVVDTYTGGLNLASVKEYVNGVAQTLHDTTGTLTSGSTSTTPFNVGSRNSTAASWYSGAMAYMRVWNQVLTPTQITALYALGPQ